MVWDISLKQKIASYLVDEAGEAVVQGLDLFFLLGTDSLDGGVDGNVHGGQQALVDLDICDGGNHGASTTTHAKTTSHAVAGGAETSTAGTATETTAETTHA